jgi:thymidylate synthase (FAD)
MDLQEGFRTKIDVLDHGYVRLVTWTPPDMVAITEYIRNREATGGADLLENNDLLAVNAARASFGASKSVLDDKDAKLIKFLTGSTPQHSSPFRHSHVSLEISAPLPIARQWWRHVIGAGTTEEGTPHSELSRRYVRGGIQYHIPAVWRSKPENSKQGSGAPVDEHLQEAAGNVFSEACHNALRAYDFLIEQGIAPEQARFVLPQGVYTSWIWTPSIQALANFLVHRLAPDAQHEIREYTKAVDTLVRPLFPLAFEGFVPSNQ